MTFGVPWNVKGIRPEARLTAKEAARRSGLSVGEWLNSVIVESAIEEGVRPRRRRASEDDDFEDRRDYGEDEEALAGVHDRLDGLSRQLEILARLSSKPAPPAAARTGKDEEYSQRLADTIDRLDRRLDQLFAEGHSETARRIGAVDRAVAGLDREPSGLDQAIAEIAARQRALEADPAAPSGSQANGAARGVEQQLRWIGGQIETLRRPCGVDAAISGLRSDLAEIGRTLTEAMPRRALAALENEIRALAERLLESRQAGADGAALARLEDKIAELRDAVRALAPAESLVGVDGAVQSLTRKIEAIAAADQDPATLRQLEEATASLRAMTSQVASNETLVRLVEEVRALAAKIDSVSAGGDVLAILDERIATLADALERRNGSAMPPQFETVLRSVNDKLERLALKSGDHAGLGAMETRIAKLLERFDATGPANGSAEPGVDALKDDIDVIKASQLDTDRRIRNSLEALNATLEHVVDRLALIETDLRAKATPQTNVLRTPEPPPTPAESRPQPAPSAPSARVPSPPAAMPKLPPPPPKPEPIDPDLPPDHPLEPGCAGRGRIAVSPSDRIAGSSVTKPPVIPDPGGKSNFIAAARRAAQAAGGTARTSSPAPVTSAAASGQKTSKRMRQLMVGVGVLVVLLGSLHVGANLLGLFDAPKPESGAPSKIDGLGRAPAPTREAKPMPEAEPTPPVPNRQSGLLPSGDMLFAPPTAGLIVPEASVPARAAPTPRQDVTGSVRLPVVPAATPEYAALPEATDKLPAAIGGPVLRAAAVNGDAAAAYEVGLRYAEGRGVAQNYEEAARWFERAVKDGLAPAQFRLGSLYEKGLGVKKDLQTARALYTAAGEKGNAKAMHNLAVLYAEGIDGKPDYRSAAQWFRKAAERGIGDSQYNLGILYARGIGVEQNLAESYKWFALAAEQGDKESGKKRDDIGARLDAQSLMAARLAAQTFTAVPQPEEATTIKPPAGGWDQASPRPAKPKPAARPKAASP